MKVLIIAGDIVEAARIKKTIEEIIKDDGMGINYDEQDTFISHNKREKKIYLLANQKDLYTDNLNDLKEQLMSQFSLSNEQVFIAAGFPH